MGFVVVLVVFMLCDLMDGKITGIDLVCVSVGHGGGGMYVAMTERSIRHGSHVSRSEAFPSQCTRNSIVLRCFQLPRCARMLATIYSSRSRLPSVVILSYEPRNKVTRSEQKTC